MLEAWRQTDDRYGEAEKTAIVAELLEEAVERSASNTRKHGLMLGGILQLLYSIGI
jgi:hypothetical protein